MSQPPKKKKLTNLDDLLTPEDLKKTEARRVAEFQKQLDYVSQEWMLIAELGFYFGWAAVQDFMSNVITIGQAEMLVQGAKNVHNDHVYDHAVAVLAGTQGNTKKTKTFDNLMKSYKNNIEG